MPHVHVHVGSREITEHLGLGSLVSCFMLKSTLINSNKLPQAVVSPLLRRSCLRVALINQVPCRQCLEQTIPTGINALNELIVVRFTKDRDRRNAIKAPLYSLCCCQPYPSA